MKLLRSSNPPPEFASVREAFGFAGQQPATVPFLRVGVLNEAGELAATGYLDGPFQVNAFGDRLSRHGYHERSQGSALSLQLCDFLFVPPSLHERECLRGELEVG